MNIKVFLLFLLWIVPTITGDVDYNQCYSPNTACMGVLNGKRSFGSNEGCIMFHNCNVAMMTQKIQSGYESTYYFTLISRWGSDFNKSFARFMVTNHDDVPFSGRSHIEAFSHRSRETVSAGSYIYYNYSRITVFGKDDQNQAYISAFYDDEIEPEPGNVTVKFTTKGQYLKYNGVENFPNVNLLDKVHIHIEFHKDEVMIDSASTDQKFQLYNIKSDSINSPTTSTTIRPPQPPPLPITSTALPETMPPTVTSSPSELATTKTLEPSPESPSAKPSEEDKKSSTSLMLIIIAVIILLVIVIGAGIGIYCCYRSKNKKTTKERSRMPKSVESEHGEVLDRIRGSSVVKSGPKSGNYKKSFTETSYDTIPQSKKTKNATTIFNNDDRYSTYFKQK